MNTGVENELRPAFSLNVALFVISTSAAGFVPPFFLAPALLLPPELVAGVAGLIFTELLWRDRVRPRLSWNSAGIHAVWSFRDQVVEWRDVDRIDHRFNFLTFVCGHERIEWEYDANVMASYFSPRHRERNERCVGSLLSAGSSAVAGSGKPPRAIPRRSVALFVVCPAVAVCECVLIF